MNKNEKNRPVHEIRYGGIKAVIWRNNTQNGPMHNVSVARLYKDGEQWKEASSFNTEDLPTLAKALLDAHSWIQLQRVAESAAA